MSDEIVNPKPKLRFFFKNLDIIYRMMRSNTDKVIEFISSNERLSSAIIPDFEGFGGPMDEGMIYILFNSEGKSEPDEIDSVYRIFWVTAPDLRYHQIDAFLISTKYENRHWNKIYRNLEFQNRSNNDYHAEVDIEEISFLMDGRWEDGYDFQFNDLMNKISGKISFNPMGSEATLVYYNGRTAIAPSAHQRFYDSFGLNINGNVEIDGDQTQIIGRGLLEHGIGVFGTSVFTGWHWMNLHFDNGAIHLFVHPIRKEEGEPFHAAEGAIWIDGEWNHFLKDDIQIEAVDHENSEIFGRQIQSSWKVKVDTEDDVEPYFIELMVKSLSSEAWKTEVTDEETHEVTNYLLDFSGKIRENEISGKGTMEILNIVLED